MIFPEQQPPGVTTAPSPGKSKLRTFGIADLAIAILLVGGTAFSVPLIGRLRPDTVVIYRGNRAIAEYPLSEDRVIAVDGAVGPMEIEVANRRVSVKSSTCPHQICKHSGQIGKAQEQVVCAPNRVLVTIRGSADKKGPDAIAR